MVCRNLGGFGVGGVTGLPSTEPGARVCAPGGGEGVAPAFQSLENGAFCPKAGVRERGSGGAVPPPVFPPGCAGYAGGGGRGSVRCVTWHRGEIQSQTRPAALVASGREQCAWLSLRSRNGEERSRLKSSSRARRGH